MISDSYGNFLLVFSVVVKQWGAPHTHYQLSHTDQAGRVKGQSIKCKLKGGTQSRAPLAALLVTVPHQQSLCIALTTHFRVESVAC